MGKPAYFEGWYFKHAARGTVLSLIPGVCRSKDGIESAFIQVITPEFSRFLGFPRNSFRICKSRDRVRVGDNRFSADGVSLHIKEKGLELEGTLRYSDLTFIRRTFLCPTLMGPFSFLSFLECRHDILSLSHRLSGELKINGESVPFGGGTGYIETDAGRAFPNAWVWYQSNVFSEPGDCVMLAAAEVPLAGFSFPGLLCVCHVGGREYRLATYSGGRLIQLAQMGNSVILTARQGDLQLQIEIGTRDAQPLAAPTPCGMRRMIREVPCCSSHVLLTCRENVLFRGFGACAGFEYVGNLSKYLSNL